MLSNDEILDGIALAERLKQYIDNLPKPENVKLAGEALDKAERESFASSEWTPELHNERLAPYRKAFHEALATWRLEYD